MSPITTIVGFTGSVREESSNKVALKLAQALLPANTRLDIIAIEELSIEEIDAHLREADALLIATPEYKGMLSRVLRSVLMQIAPEGVAGKPAALLGVGRSDQSGNEHPQLRHLLNELDVAVLDEQVSISAAQLNDQATDNRIRALLTNLVERVHSGSSVLAN